MGPAQIEAGNGFGVAVKKRFVADDNGKARLRFRWPRRYSACSGGGSCKKYRWKGGTRADTNVCDDVRSSDYVCARQVVRIRKAKQTRRASPGVATAAPIRECGDLPHRFAFNITTRKVRCKEARRVVRRWNNTVAKRGGTGRVRGLFCRYRDTGHEAGDIRCTGSRGRVVRWQTSS